MRGARSMQLKGKPLGKQQGAGSVDGHQEPSREGGHQLTNCEWRAAKGQGP